MQVCVQYASLDAAGKHDSSSSRSSQRLRTESGTAAAAATRRLAQPGLLLPGARHTWRDLHVDSTMVLYTVLETPGQTAIAAAQRLSSCAAH